MERVMRSLELHAAPTAEDRAFARGKHSGEDRARKQIVWVALVAAVVGSLAVVGWPW
jgi:hypothetical protein